MTPPEPENEGRFQNLTGLAAVVLTIALISTPFQGVIAIGRPTEAPRVAPPFIWYFPYLLIAALLSSGFRILGDLVAVITAVPAFLLFGLLGLLAGLGGTGSQGVDGGALVFALLQALMFFAALGDLITNRKLPHQPVPLVNRVLGLGVPLATYLVAVGIVAAALKGDRNRVDDKALDARLEANAQAGRWMSESSFENVVRLAQCVEQSRGDSVAGPAPRSLRALYEWSVAKGTEPYNCGYRLYQRPEKNVAQPKPIDTLPHPYEYDIHHVVYYEPPKDHNDPFRSARITLGIEAVWDSAEFPNALGTPGARSYLLDPDGRIHVTSEHRRATVSDSVIPVCGPPGYSYDSHECAPQFTPRQRWGRFREVAQFGFDVSDITLPDSLLSIFRFRQINGLDSVRSLSIDWGDAQKPVMIRFAPSESFGRMVEYEGKKYRQNDIELLLWHKYRTAGEKIVRGRLVTRAGDEYVHVDSLVVKEPDPE